MITRMRIDTHECEQALAFLGDERAHAVIKEEMRVLAGASALGSMQNAPPNVRVSTFDISNDSRGFIGWLIGATHPTDNPDGDMRIPNWTNYGTRGRRRKMRSGSKSASKLPPTPGTGQRAQRFIKRISKTRRSEVIARGVMLAARMAGFNTSGRG